ncbi:MAG: squalene synthase HpnC, partial [Betaproteobacteria bacterium]|nr:squalene synthase HpnC [Betaproteobacteria bacterium]
MTSALPSSVDHYENFPVASWLCPPRLRAPIAAIYHFARTADDLADEGNASPSERLGALGDFRQDLHALSPAEPAGWPHIFKPLHRAIEEYSLPVQLLDDLLDAFVQDVQYTANGHVYANPSELLDYCRRSANPVGRLLLHLYGVHDHTSLKQSD